MKNTFNIAAQLLGVEDSRLNVEKIALGVLTTGKSSQTKSQSTN